MKPSEVMLGFAWLEVGLVAWNIYTHDPLLAAGSLLFGAWFKLRSQKFARGGR